MGVREDRLPAAWGRADPRAAGEAPGGPVPDRAPPALMRSWRKALYRTPALPGTRRARRDVVRSIGRHKRWQGASCDLPPEHARGDLARDVSAPRAELRAEGAALRLQLFPPLLHEAGDFGARLREDLRLELGPLGSQPLALLRRRAPHRFELRFVALEQLSRLFVHLAGKQLGPFGSALALLEKLEERIEQKRLQNHDEGGERRQVHEKGEVEVEVYPSAGGISAK